MVRRLSCGQSRRLGSLISIGGTDRVHTWSEGRSARVLDLGCGTGADAIFLAGQNYDVHGLDFSAEALRLAKQRAGEHSVVLAWHESSALKTPFDNGYFDLITDRGCCHYMAGSIRRQYAEEVARILRPGGTLFLRGCRIPEDTSFATINRNSLVECFDPRLFEIGPVIPFYLTVDNGGIDANAVSIVRRDLSIVGGPRATISYIADSAISHSVHPLADSVPERVFT